MYGDSILVSPKINWREKSSQKWVIDTLLPASALWFEWNSKTIESQ
jgi:hypothetical protein